MNRRISCDNPIESMLNPQSKLDLHAVCGGFPYFPQTYLINRGKKI